METVKELKKLVAIPSTYPHEKKMGEYVYSLLKEAGFTVKKQFIDGARFNVLAEKGTGDKSILFYAHLDTVGVVEGWKTNPLKLTIVGDKAYGLGAWDMKAGLLANILAARAIVPKNMKIKMVFCVDEEYISRGGHALMKNTFMYDVACVISTEPAFQHGVQGIVTGRIGRSVYDVAITGPSHHFAFYDPKKDINFALSDFIQATKKLFKKTGDKKQFVFVRSVESRTVGMSLPEKITLELDSSVLPPHTHGSILSFLQTAATKIERKYGSFFTIKVEKHVRETPFLEPYTVAKDNPYLKTLQKSVLSVTKKRAIPYFRSSVADENIFGAAGIPTLGIGPIGGNAHGANEWVSLRSIRELVAILSHFISATDGL